MARGLGRAGAIIFKEVTKPGVPKKQDKLRYRAMKGWTSGMPVDKALRRLKGTNIHPLEKKRLEVELENLGKVGGTRWVTKEKVSGVRKRLEELIGVKEAESVMNILGLENEHGLFGRNKSITGKKAGQVARTAKGISRGKREIAARLIEGLDQPRKLSNQKGITEAHLDEIAAGTKDKHVATKFRRAFFYNEESADDDTTIERPKGKVHGWSLSRGKLPGWSGVWGRRSGSQNSAGSKNSDTKKVSPY